MEGSKKTLQNRSIQTNKNQSLPHLEITNPGSHYRNQPWGALVRCEHERLVWYFGSISLQRIVYNTLIEWYVTKTIQELYMYKCALIGFKNHLKNKVTWTGYKNYPKIRFTHVTFNASSHKNWDYTTHWEKNWDCHMQITTKKMRLQDL